MAYNWVITADHIETDAVGTRHWSHDNINAENETKFRMFDDDGVLYYEGKIWGDHDGFEPLDDFGTPNAGCTYIMYKEAGGWKEL